MSWNYYVKQSDIDIPDEFKHVVFKTKSLSEKDNLELRKLVEDEFNHVKLDYLFETIGKGANTKINMHLMMIFETPADALAFKLKYGNKYA